MKWTKPDVDPTLVREIAGRHNIDMITASVLARRGVTEPAEARFIFESDLRYLHNPFLLEEMEDAVGRILLAAAEGEKVLVFGDRDVDGITSTTLMVEALRRLEIDVAWRVPMGDEPYGLSSAVVDECVDLDVTLIVCVDCGITNAAEIAEATAKGIDTVVVDHHNPKEDLPPAVAVINPKLPDTAYPFDGLAACAVTSKVCWALSFASTPAYGQDVTLLNIRPGNETLIVECVRMENLVELDRISEQIVPGMVAVEQTRLPAFLVGRPIIVYDEAVQTRYLRSIFGNDAEIGVVDLATEAHALFPSLRGMSLLRMRKGSRLAHYSDRPIEEIDVLVGLFEAVVLKKQDFVGEAFEETLDLVAMGTLADMMPLKDENRILVRRGLDCLRRTLRPGLRELLERQNISGRSLDSKDVAWQLSPVINASGRMGSPDVAVRLLLNEAPEEKSALADQIIDLNTSRKRSGDEAWDRVLPHAKKSLEEHNGRFVMVADKHVPRGVTGILAGRLARMFEVPSLVVAFLEDKAVGSMRSARGFGVTAFLKRFEDVLDDWGGHDSAGGFSLPADRLPLLIERIAQEAGGIELGDAEGEVLMVDAEVPEKYFTPDLYKVVETLGPYGQDYPPILFLARGLRIVDIDFMGRGEQKHARLTLDAGQNKWPAVYWRGAEKIAEGFKIKDRVSIVFSLSKNHYQGRETLRLVISDIKPAERV